jgi:hypothetical protein
MPTEKEIATTYKTLAEISPRSLGAFREDAEAYLAPRRARVKPDYWPVEQARIRVSNAKQEIERTSQPFTGNAFTPEGREQREAWVRAQQVADYERELARAEYTRLLAEYMAAKRAAEGE